MPGANNSNQQGSPFEIVTSAKSKKSGKKGLIIALLIVVFLALSVVAGVILVRQRQQIAEKAQVTTITPSPKSVTFPKAGKIRVYYRDFTHTENFLPLRMIFTTLGGTDTVNFPGGALTGTARMAISDTDINVTAGETVSFQNYFANETNPSFGWTPPDTDGACGPAKQVNATPDIAWATSQAQGEQLLSKQCWGDAANSGGSNSDYNDYFIILSYVPTQATTPSPTPTTEATISPSPSSSPSGSSSPTVSPTASSTAKASASVSPTSTTTAQTSPLPIPETGTDWPTLFGIGAGAAAIILSILVAL